MPEAHTWRMSSHVRGFMVYVTQRDIPCKGCHCLRRGYDVNMLRLGVHHSNIRRNETECRLKSCLNDTVTRLEKGLKPNDPEVQRNGASKNPTVTLNE